MVGNANAAPRGDREAIARDHGVMDFGVSGWKVEQPHQEEAEHWTDAQRARMDEGFGAFAQADVYRDDGQQRPDASVNWTDAQKARMDEGFGAFARSDGKELWGTSSAEQQKLTSDILRADWLKNPGDMLDQLPDESVQKIVAQRYKNVADQLDRNSFQLQTSATKRKELGQRLDTDLAIIANLIQKDRLTEGKDFDIAIYAGEENKQDLHGVLEAYSSMLKDFGTEIPLVNGEDKTERTDVQSGAVCDSATIVDRMAGALERKNEPAAETGNGFAQMANEVDDFETHIRKMQERQNNIQ